MYGLTFINIESEIKQKDYHRNAKLAFFIIWLVIAVVVTTLASMIFFKPIISYVGSALLILIIIISYVLFLEITTYKFVKHCDLKTKIKIFKGTRFEKKCRLSWYRLFSVGAVYSNIQSTMPSIKRIFASHGFKDKCALNVAMNYYQNKANGSKRFNVSLYSVFTFALSLTAILMQTKTSSFYQNISLLIAMIIFVIIAYSFLAFIGYFINKHIGNKVFYENIVAALSEILVFGNLNDEDESLDRSSAVKNHYCKSDSFLFIL